jgi:hypothetical protein
MHFQDIPEPSLLSFEEYLQMSRDIVSGKQKEKIYEPESMLRYTRSNLERMEYVLREMTIEKKLYNRLSEQLPPMQWVVITEPWCGDASQLVPVLYLVACCSSDIRFSLILRDKNPKIMDQYLTDGSRSIPLLMVFEESSGECIGRWGPRPQNLQQKLQQMKLDETSDFRSLVRNIHEWYRQDLGKSCQQELIDLIPQWKKNAQNLRNPV